VGRPYHLVVEDDPDPRDLALLEDKLAAAAVTAVGAGEEEEFGIFVRDDAGRIVAGASASVVTGWPPSSWPKPRPRRGAGAAGWSWASPMTC